MRDLGPVIFVFSICLYVWGSFLYQGGWKTRCICVLVLTLKRAHLFCINLKVWTFILFGDCFYVVLGGGGDLFGSVLFQVCFGKAQN